jgi:hypothetical protein
MVTWHLIPVLKNGGEGGGSRAHLGRDRRFRPPSSVVACRRCRWVVVRVSDSCNVANRDVAPCFSCEQERRRGGEGLHSPRDDDDDSCRHRLDDVAHRRATSSSPSAVTWCPRVVVCLYRGGFVGGRRWA